MPAFRHQYLRHGPMDCWQQKYWMLSSWSPFALVIAAGVLPK